MAPPSMTCGIGTPSEAMYPVTLLNCGKWPFKTARAGYASFGIGLGSIIEGRVQQSEGTDRNPVK